MSSLQQDLFPTEESSPPASPARTSPSQAVAAAWVRAHAPGSTGTSTGSWLSFVPAWVLLENVPGLLSSLAPASGTALRRQRAGHRLRRRAALRQVRSLRRWVHGLPMEERWVPSSGAWETAGMGSPTECWTLSSSESPNAAAASSLSDILETGPVPAQVLLEPEGCTGDPAPSVPPRPRVAADAADGVAEAGRVVTALTTKAGNTLDDQQTQQLIATHTHRPRTFQKVIRSGARDVNGDLPAEVWAERDIAATLNLNDLGSESRAVELVVQPMAVRGRSDGADLEIAADGDPCFALRAGDGGSSRSQLVSITGPVTHALTSEGADASEDGGTGRGTPIIGFSHTAGIDQQPSESVFPTIKAGHDGMPATATAVRRLTPLECERLQGFPDGWTEALRAASFVFASSGWGTAKDSNEAVEAEASCRCRQAGGRMRWSTRGLGSHARCARCPLRSAAGSARIGLTQGSAAPRLRCGRRTCCCRVCAAIGVCPTMPSSLSTAGRWVG
jgi:hypothetical protein